MSNEARLTELERRLENMLRVGTIAEADYATARVRVKDGDMLTGWLPWFTHRASTDTTWWAPEVGEQVMVLSPSGDPAQGVVLPAIFQNAYPPPESRPSIRRVDFGDGCVCTYDREAKHFEGQLPGTARIECAGNLTAIGKIIHFNP